MRKNIIIAAFAAVLFCLSQIATAVPAKPGKVVRTQPDGSKITVIVHGDEWFHYVTDEAGNLLEENASGFMVRSTQSLSQAQEKMALAKAAKSDIAAVQNLIQKAPAKGSPKIPVILVQFSDKAFTLSNPKAAFTALLTQRGYTANGGTGSVLDYYIDQSRGAYSPQFVVMDVVTLSGNMRTYGSTDENAAKALYEACQKLNATVDFSQFDNDGDGKIDMALMYYAGYNEAEGGSSDTIWPHQFYVPYVVTSAQAFDGVTLNRYFCTSELKGYSGRNMCGIGTTCHEFAHSLGLPDFYDTNYNNYGDGEAGATYDYDVMCSGSYNNDGCTPPWMNAEELVMLGWMNSISELPARGNVTIPSIGAATPVAYKSPTSAEGEYFLYECRPAAGWDAPLTGGMIVYHVDKSPSHSITWRRSTTQNATQTAYNLWANWETYNAINCNGSHPCFYIIPSGNQSSLNYTGSNFAFPGAGNVTTFSPVDWSKSETGYTLTSIAFNRTAQTVTFNLLNDNEYNISGLVLDSSNKAIEGATVTLSAEAPATKSPSSALVMRAPARAAGAVLQTTVTDASGSYSFTVDNPGTYVIEVSKEGYITGTSTVQVSTTGGVSRNFKMFREGESKPTELYTYSDDTDWYRFGSGTATSWSIMCSNIYPKSFLEPYVGKQIKSISFIIGGDENTTFYGAYGLVDFGTTRKAWKGTETAYINGWNTIDLTDQELVIPAGTDIYAGYALDRWAYTYPLYATEAVSSELTGYTINSFNSTSTAWTKFSVGDGSDYAFLIKMEIGDYDMGYNYIDDPKKGSYNVNDEFALSLIETQSERKPNASGVKWFFDDEPVSGSVILKTPGEHVVSAKFTTVSGEKKTVYLEIDVR